MNFIISLLNRSIIARSGFALGAIAFITLVTVTSSAYITNQVEGHAAAINLAGSLRMQSYRVVMDLLESSHRSQAEKKEVLQKGGEQQLQRLLSPVLLKVIPSLPQHLLNKIHTDLLAVWNAQIIPRLSSDLSDHEKIDDLSARLVEFANAADVLVAQIQLDEEDKIRQMQIIQWVSIILILFIILVAMFDLVTNIVVPLRGLVDAAKAARRGDFSVRVEAENPDELGTLADAFNVMAEDLSAMYKNLAFRVEEKTEELQTSNKVLQLLYSSSTHLTEERDSEKSIRQVLDDLRNAIHFESITLYLQDELTHAKTLQVSSVETVREPKLASLCKDKECEQCLQEPVTENNGAESCERKQKLLSFPVQHNQQKLGVLYAEFSEEEEPDPWKIQIIRTIADNIATRVSLNLQSDQEQRLSLMEERAVIARELHDSLAQALSYLKIQVTRLESLRSRKASSDKIDDVVSDLDEGLSSAYRQLRELLTTFRLKLDKPSLNAAIIDTVEEFCERGGIPIDLEFDIGAVHLRPNEEIHILQIVREALSNVLRHSRAQNAMVVLQSLQSGEVEVLVQDDGVGIPDKLAELNHYGVIIMQERASSLHGKITIQRRAEGGTEVKLLIPSKSDS
mgnify:CR=1 FL=1